jgi:outer membrane protein assembly factor BamB
VKICRRLPALAGRSLFAAILLLAGSTVFAQWPQWRGPGGHGVSAERNLPTEWSPAEDGKPAVNIKWKTAIPGRGHSSPIAAHGLVFVTTALKGKEVPGRKAPVHLDFQKQPGYLHPDAVDVEFEHTLKVYAVDGKTGTVAWERTAYDGVMFDDRHRKNTYASPTMAVDEERAYAFFESLGLYAYDFKGNLVWKKTLGPIIKAGLGPGTSPIIYKDLIILQCDQEMGDGSAIVALNRKTGEEVWRAARDNRRSWATPLVVNTGARDELIASGAEVVIAYDPLTGKELWRSDGTRSHPIPSPVTTRGMIFGQGGDGHASGRRGRVAI